MSRLFRWLTVPAIVAGLFIAVFISPVSAQVTSDTLCTGAAANSAFCQAQAHSGASDSLLFGPDGILTKVISILVLVITFISVIVIVIAGFRFVTSGGNPQSAGSARSAIIYAAVGLVIAMLAQFIVAFVLNRMN